MRFLRKRLMPSGWEPAFGMTVILAIYCLLLAVGDYIYVYLTENGFTPSQIGTFTALCNLSAILAMLAWGTVSDRINSIKKTLLVCLAGAGITFTLIPVFTPSVPGWAELMIFLVLPVAYAFRGCMGTLFDNFSVRCCAQEHVTYGTVRAIGSISFMAGSLLTAYFTVRCGLASIFWVSGLLTLPLLYFISRRPDPKVPEPASRGREGGFRCLSELLRSPYYIAFLLFAVAFNVPASAEISYLPYLIRQIGVSGTQYGSLLAVRAGAEIPVLFLVSRLQRKFPRKYLIMASASFMALECLGFSLLAQDLIGLLLLCAVYGVGSGLFLGNVPQYVVSLAPNRLKATAQSIYASVSSAACILGSFAGGFLFEAMGARPFYLLVGVLYFAAAALFAASFLLLRRRPNPADAPDSAV